MVGQVKCQPAWIEQSYKPHKANFSACLDMGALFDRWYNQGGNHEVEGNYVEPLRK